MSTKTSGDGYVLPEWSSTHPEMLRSRSWPRAKVYAVAPRHAAVDIGSRQSSPRGSRASLGMRGAIPRKPSPANLFLSESILRLRLVWTVPFGWLVAPSLADASISG